MTGIYPYDLAGNFCSECGHRITVTVMDYTRGDRVDTAPRHRPQPLAPFRSKFERP
jgi:hypothetical protein